MLFIALPHTYSRRQFPPVLNTVSSLHRSSNFQFFVFDQHRRDDPNWRRLNNTRFADPITKNASYLGMHVPKKELTPHSSPQIIWMGMTRTHLLGRKRLVVSANDRLRILQDAAQNLWSKDFISPARFVQLIVLLDCPNYEGKPVTVICMEKTLDTIAGLVTPNVLGEGLRSQISAGGFSFAAHLRSHILSSTTLHQALAVPPPPSTSPNGPPARLRGRSDVPHRFNAALIQASIALLEQEGAFSGRRVRGGRGGGDGERDAGQKEKYWGELDGEEEKKVRAMIALLKRTRDQRASATCYAWWSVRETPLPPRDVASHQRKSREQGVCI